MKDDQALEDIRNKGQTGFIILYKRYAKPLHYHLTCKYKIPMDAVDDVLQEIFFKFFKDIESFREDCSILTWLNTIAKSVASDYWRKNAKEDNSVNYNDDYNDDTEQNTELFDIIKLKSQSEEDHRDIKICLEQTQIHLKREGKTELLKCLEALLWQQEGLSIQEISEKIGKSYDATKTYLSECKNKLAQYPPIQECKGIFLKICLERVKAKLEREGSKDTDIIACLETIISRLQGTSIENIAAQRGTKIRETKAYLSSCIEKLKQHPAIPKKCQKWLDYLK
jgi:RNA polymerase sigma factor (sigma-70 family)